MKLLKMVYLNIQSSMRLYFGIFWVVIPLRKLDAELESQIEIYNKRSPIKWNIHLVNKMKVKKYSLYFYLWLHLDMGVKGIGEAKVIKLFPEVGDCWEFNIPIFWNPPISEDKIMGDGPPRSTGLSSVLDNICGEFPYILIKVGGRPLFWSRMFLSSSWFIRLRKGDELDVG